MTGSARDTATASRPRGVLRHDEPMSRHTAWRVGGRAERLYEPADLDDLAVFLRRIGPSEPVHMIGLGSNLLVRDGGISGTVILTSGALAGIDRTADERVRAEAGVACAKVARFSLAHGLCGCEFFAGIPGTVGGALTMNAGAFGSETWDIVRRVETIDRAGVRRWRGRDEFSAEYRTVSGPLGEWFAAAEFDLVAGNPAAASARVRSLLKRRAATQPVGQRSCGSVFRNPPGDFAARLIEGCGLKGKRIGGAAVSDKHANFIVNDAGASAADIERLIDYVAGAVEHARGVRLVPEVRIIGRAAAADASSIACDPGTGEDAGGR